MIALRCSKDFLEQGPQDLQFEEREKEVPMPRLMASARN
jgi:hypothetical protein